MGQYYTIKSLDNLLTYFFIYRICNNEQRNVTEILDEKARTSIMFAAGAPSVSMFCDEGNHDRYAPNKHNFMCERRSALDVILQHPDFLTSDHRSLGGQQITNTTPAVSYKRRSLTRYVLIVEDTQEMLVRESWTYLRNAVRKWAVYDLPGNTEVALIMMNESSASTLLHPTALHNHSARDVLASNIPYTPGDGRAPGCIQCALQEALKLLEGSIELRGPASSVILLVAPGTRQDIKTLEQAKRAASLGVRISTINYPGVLRPSPLDSLAELTGGPAYTVQERKHNIDTSLLTTYFQLTNVLYAIAERFQEIDGPAPGMPVEIHRRELTDDYRSSITGSFVLDESMGEPARFSLFAHNVESPLIRSLSLWSPSQVEYTRRSDSMLVVKIITLAAPISEPGTWTYRIERWSGNPQPHYVQVMASAKPGFSSGVVRARFWVTRPRPGLLLLRAEVKRGALPVLGARLEVVVTRPEFNGTQSYKDKFELLDTGSGDPDVTRGDGVYSRYWSASSTGPGAYTFEVTVTDNGNTAYCSLEGPNDEPCCGSKTPTNKVEPLQPFQRVPSPVTMQISAEDALAATQITAGRIGDLRSHIFAPERRVRLTWSSPDMAGVSASRYEVRYAHSVQDITDGFETSASLWEQGQPFPLAAGSDISFTLNFTGAENERLLGRPVYLAVKAYAGSGDFQSGLVSNWVRVLVPKPIPPPITVSPDLSTSDYTAWPFPDSDSGSVNVDASLPGIARSPELGVQLILPIVIGAVLLLLLLVLYCYFCVLRKRGRHDGKKPKSTKSDKLQSAITIVPSSPAHSLPVQNIQPPDEQHAYTNELHTVGVPINYQYDDEPKKRYSLVQQQEQQLIEELKQQQQYGTVGMNVSVISGGTLQRNGRTLSPYESWSASQLLHEHERRHSPMDEMLQPPPPQQYTDQYGNNLGVPPPVPPLPSYNGYPVNYSIYGVHPSQQLVYHQPPPPFNVSLQGSVSSVNSAEKKKRNVTMV